jgi:hypothetical protein
MAGLVNLPQRREFECSHRVDVMVRREDGCYQFLVDDDLGGYFARSRQSHSRKDAPSSWAYWFSDERTAFAFKMRFG